MPLTWKDRVKQTVSAGGTGALTLGSASSGYQALAAGDNGLLFAYVIEDGTAWETGYGTYTHSGTSFARTSRTASSTGSALNVSTNAVVFVDIGSSIAQGMDLAAQAIAPGGRLTLESGVPVSITDQTAKTTVYYTPYVSNIIVLWDGNRWQPVTFAETSLALGTLTASKLYDVFGYLSGGALALEMLVWTNDTTRATAVTLQDGRYCKSGAKDRLYLGTFYTASTTTTEDSVVKRYLYSHHNQALKQGVKISATSHTYTTGTWRIWGGDSANCIDFIVGVGPVAMSISTYNASSGAINAPTLNSSSPTGSNYVRVDSTGAVLSGSQEILPIVGFNKLQMSQFGLGSSVWASFELTASIPC
jgi:hypothetical protein